MAILRPFSLQLTRKMYVRYVVQNTSDVLTGSYSTLFVIFGVQNVVLDLFGLSENRGKCVKWAVFGHFEAFFVTTYQEDICEICRAKDFRCTHGVIFHLVPLFWGQKCRFGRVRT